MSCFSPQLLLLASTNPCDTFTSQQMWANVADAIQVSELALIGTCIEKNRWTFLMNFNPIQSQSLSYPGNMNAIGLEDKMKQVSFCLFESVVLWNRMLFSFSGRALTSTYFSFYNHLTVNDSNTFERNKKWKWMLWELKVIKRVNNNVNLVKPREPEHLLLHFTFNFQTLRWRKRCYNSWQMKS